MGKQIIILNGSPHGNGTTASLIKAFTEGAKDGGAEVTEFVLNNMNIRGCLGCFKGNSENENPCIIDDDMSKIYPVLKKAEVVVFASPVYFWAVSGQLKTALDRMVALEEGTDILHREGRSAVLLMSSDGDDDQYTQVSMWYQHLLGKFRWKDLGHVLATGNEDVQNPEHTLVIEDAKGLGQRAASDHEFL